MICYVCARKYSKLKKVPLLEINGVLKKEIVEFDNRLLTIFLWETPEKSKLMLTNILKFLFESTLAQPKYSPIT